MATFRKSAIVMGAAMTAMFAGSAFAIDSKADCEYEGGEVFNVHGDQVCVIQIRGEAFHGEEYDGQQLGVKECKVGEQIADGLFCKITLVKAKKTPKLSPEEAGVGLKVGDVVNEKGEKVDEAALKKAEDMAKDAAKDADK